MNTQRTAKRVTIASDDSDETTDRDQYCEVIENRNTDLVVAGVSIEDLNSLTNENRIILITALAISLSALLLISQKH